MNDIDLYRIFYLVNKFGSFSKCAEELNTTQPAISYKIKKLEDSLGFLLFSFYIEVYNDYGDNI